MIHVFPFEGRIVAVLGLGRTGLSAAAALMRSRAEVWAWDDDPAARDAAAGAGIPLVDLSLCDWSTPKSLVLSPGIPHTHPRPHPVVALARHAGCEVIGDIEMLARTQRDATFIGVTGTNGKSTTTALLGHILDAAGHPSQVGGNIGVPVLELQPVGPGGLFVLEVSSYQLELTPSLTFDVAVLLNISADHLERHGGMAGYVAAKTLIFRRQTAGATAVVGIDDEPSRAVFDELRESGEQVVVPISGGRRAAGGVHAGEGVLRDDGAAGDTTVLDMRRLAHLPGVHNWQNAAAAFAAARAVGVPADAIASGIRSYPGLRHRQEPVATIDGVRYVNDSKATNPDAAAKALACYDTIYWIAGGRAKEGGLEAMGSTLGRIRHVFLIGEAADAFAAALAGKVSLSKPGNLEKAVAEAQAMARMHEGRDAVVLLSPACASFDQFDDFEARGDAFHALVGALPGRRGE
jgi:UDP-N-acetylmuramoylalanine--D-glutamate ligase